MDVKTFFWSLIFRPLLALTGFFIVSCSDINHDEVSTVLEIKQTRLHAGSDMQMDYRIDSQLKVNLPVVIALSFQLEPYQLMALEIQDSDRFQWLRILDAVYQADEAGVVSIEMNIMPLQAGKAYIKFIAATVDGTSVRSFAIPLAVYDDDNHLPVKAKKPLDRINLPATH